MTTTDMWEDAQAFHYRNLPEMTLSQFFTEERDMLCITRETDGYWLSDSRTAMQDRYPNLASAKVGGDREIERLERMQNDVLLREAGLSAETWTIEYGDGMSFVQRDGPLSIVSDRKNGPKWILFDADDMIARGRIDVVTEAVLQLIRQ